MNPILFSFGSVKFYTYGVIVFLSWTFGFLITYLLLRKYKTKHVDKFDTLLYITLVGFLGARIFYFIFYFYKFDSFWQMFYFWQNGMTVFGGLFAASIFALWYFIKKDEKIWFWFDNLTIGFYCGYFVANLSSYLLKFGNISVLQISLIYFGLVILLMFRFVKIKFSYPGLIFLLGFVFFSLGQIIFDFISHNLFGFNQILSIMILFLILNLLLEIKIKRKIGLWNQVLNHFTLFYLWVRRRIPF